MALAPLINGRRYSFTSIELALKVGASAQAIVTDVEDVSYSESLVIAYKYGTSAVPIGTTRGRWEAQEGSFLMGKSAVTDLITKIGPGWMGLNFVALCTYADIGEPLTVDTIIGRIFTGIEDAHSSGPDALNQTVKFMPTGPIIRNGVPGMLNRVF